MDAFLTINGDGSVTLFSGKVDLGQGLRIALRQIVAEELGVPIDRIELIEGDTALTPDQGRTAGSNGIQQGGVQIRQAAATARQALVELASKRLNVPAGDLVVADGEVRPTSGGGVKFADLLAGNKFNLKLDAKAPLKDPRTYTIVGKVLPRPDVPAKVTGSYTYVHDVSVPGMLHGRVIRPPAIGAELISVDESSIANLPGAKVVRIKNFLGVVAEDEWTCVRAMRALKAQWSEWNGLPTQAELLASMRAGPFVGDEAIVKKGEPSAAPADATALKATYYWPIQTHGSIGPSCAVADVKPDSATIWTASQGTHGNHTSFANASSPAQGTRVRLILSKEGSGCYGMNGHEDAAADAAIMSRAVGQPVRVQWMRHDEHGWDPKGPPQLLDLAATIDREGRLIDWRTDTFIPQATRGLPNIPLLGPDHAGIDQPRGIGTGLLQQNLDPSYAARSVVAVAHWLKDTPLRPASIRSPGKPANCFAVESFVDELAAAAKIDPVAMRLKSLSDPRGIEVIKRVAAMMKWQPRTSPRSRTPDAVARGRGFAYLHYKHSEAYVAMGMEVTVERSTGRIQVERVVCAHDCGLIINPDGVRAQVEGCILQTISRVLMEEVKFDRSRVTSVDWVSYPIMRFSQTPKLEIELIDRPTEKPVGAGEASSAPVGAALGNAVFDAVGVRLRTIPFTPERLRATFGRNTA